MLIPDMENRIIEESRDRHIEDDLDRLFPFLKNKKIKSSKRSKRQFKKAVREINDEMEGFTKEHNIYMQRSRESASRAYIT